MTADSETRPKAPLHRYQALCCDYDGTLAHDGVVSPEMVKALERVAASGRRLLLVSGRELDDLRRVFEPLHVFDRVVAENGALLFTPETSEERVLCDPPSEVLVRELQRRHVAPLSVGRAIVATWQPHDAHGAGGIARARAGDERGLQQGRRDGVAHRRQQGQRPRRGAAVAGAVAPQRHRHRRCRERSRVPGALPGGGGGGQCAAGAEGGRRHRHARQPRRRRARADRRTAGR